MAQQTYPTPAFGPPAPHHGPVPPRGATSPYGSPATSPYGSPATPPYGPPAGPPHGPQAGGSGQQPAPRRRTAAVIGATVAAVLVLGGLVVGAVLIFGTKVLDTADAEREIARLTQQQAGVAPTDVSCPADIEAAAGATFTCSGLLEGQPVSFTVRQTDDDGSVFVTSDNSFVDVAVVEAALTSEWTEVAGVDVVTTCDTAGHSVLVDGVGAPITCTVTNAMDASDSVDVVATVDANGSVSYEVL
ncbi:DUF4333 domain-containing protein [Geodermatophilus sp. YIM 151500]|uniref:DUF4333 domain-containing protein n=1 Tax=Geodermatophilus sp. YIM 151500 TaxID=2984531 RepID=UPI0021E4C26E|nr:DUF4333 domain-containing protein [Geodermatophilus sp. YIM 151500]MCV2487846.1 DUF4333 domain-containing protein [Geodermatophilus sp. YIM 151500]